MKSTTSIKRVPALQPLSHDHHHGLLLSWKIRTGFKKNINLERIKKYADWFFEDQLLPHFEAEEKYVFPILGNHHEFVKRALSDHRKLKRLFNAQCDLDKNLVLIEERLESHIRFEERILFNEVQAVATEKELSQLALEPTFAPDALYPEQKWEDEFWK